MIRSSLIVLLAALVAISFVAAQTDQKIDVNLASAPELQKLPGIDADLARKIISERPYSKPADLSRAGLSLAQIRQLTLLITFSAIQPEKPGPQGGAVASVPIERLNRCADDSASAKPQSIYTKMNGKSAAVCVPRAWFTADGESITYTGKTELSGLIEGWSKSSGKQLKIVYLDSGNLASGRAQLLADELKGRGARNVEVMAAKPSGSMIGGFTHKIEDAGPRYGTTFVDLNKTASGVDTLLLVVPGQQAFARSVASSHGSADRASGSKSDAAASVGAGTSTEVMTNEQILALVKSGINEENLVANIKDAPAVNFDLSVAAEMRLTQGGVPNSVIYAMRRKSASEVHRTHPPAKARAIAIGQSIDDVTKLLGQPTRIVDLGAKKIYIYGDLKVTFEAGRVSLVE